MKISDYIAYDACVAIRKAIDEADGNEVFFVGTVEDSVVVEAKVLARGNENEVPAIIENCRSGDVVIHNHPTGLLKPSSADNRIASALGNEGVGFFIVDNAASEIYVSVEPACFEAPAIIDFEEIKNYLSANGPLAKHLPDFEERLPQIEMLRHVTTAFNEEKIALLEAGTGTGKTLAYLIPAIHWSLANKHRVLISTNTINLQQQLTEKDIPLLNAILPFKFKAALVKGRTNYVCQRKLFEARQQPDLLDIDKGEDDLAKLAAWARKTTDGSKADLGFIPDSKVWEHIQSESDTSLKKKCPFYKTCFFYGARRKALTADILIANHHLLFADLAVRISGGDAAEVAVLPKYNRLVLDEAHNLEDIASQHFGISASYLGTIRVLGRLYRVKSAKELGQIPFLKVRMRLNSSKIHRDLCAILELQIEDAYGKIEDARYQLESAMSGLFAWIVSRESASQRESKIRLTDEVLSASDWKSAVNPMPEALKKLHDVVTEVDKIVRTLSKITTSFEKEAASISVDLKAQSARLATSAKEISAVLFTTDDVNINWIEGRDSRYGLILHFRSAPLDVSNSMRMAVFERHKSVVMTSATLTVSKSFKYMANRLGVSGVDDERILQARLPAPFDYHKQVIIGIPTDMPEPNSPDFVGKLGQLLPYAIRMSKGRAIVLFTSYNLLNKMDAHITPAMDDDGINVYKQGAESRHRLLDRFRTDISSVLLATDSFWEGIDVKGEALVQVIIPRLPFRVPSEPVIEARMEAIEKAGGNSFLDFTVPQAVLKFKQGFGRLIRSKDDYGAMLLLDTRVINKVYGRVFLKSLPDCTSIVGSRREVLRGIASFLEERQQPPV